MNGQNRSDVKIEEEFLYLPLVLVVERVLILILPWEQKVN